MSENRPREDYVLFQQTQSKLGLSLRIGSFKERTMIEESGHAEENKMKAMNMNPSLRIKTMKKKESAEQMKRNMWGRRRGENYDWKLVMKERQSVLSSIKNNTKRNFGCPEERDKKPSRESSPQASEHSN
ncbi:unnamed protein product [Lepeophtheirus salmonis]|uniref:(salmon louse) hypothetical protein n=1 Tax=Lepeophtheirus salmonis TaxID=72036 RepID=A0A7R8CJX4_LEPSM|nr:unnamed protein product [Lepeophtheirus salmonis]CAF2843648.1 unnamed protein product [Lepeophtheirus salmonis]